MPGGPSVVCLISRTRSLNLVSFSPLARNARTSSIGRSMTTVAPNRPPATAPSSGGWARRLSGGRAERERAAAEVVARRRGQVGDQRGDVVVGRRIAGQHRGGADRVARPFDRQRP